VKRLGAIIEQLSKELTLAGGRTPTKGRLRALWSLSEKGWKLSFLLADAIGEDLDPTEEASRWLERQDLPEEVPDVPYSVWELPDDEREVYLARQHVGACLDKLWRLWLMANEQATMHKPFRVHAALREMERPLLHMAAHLHPTSGCCIT